MIDVVAEAEMGLGRNTVLAGAALGVLATGAAARTVPPATVVVTGVTAHAPGWLRVAVRWEGERRPSLRLVPVCRDAERRHAVLGARVTLSTARRVAFLDVRDDLAWLTDQRQQPCAVTGVAVEMLRGRRVAARAPVPLPLPPDYPPPPLPPALEEKAPRLGFATDSRGAPEARSAEAGLRWSLSRHVALDLSFERTTLGSAVPLDPGNGVRTSVRVGF